MNHGWSDNRTPIWDKCFHVAPGELKQFWKNKVSVPLCEKRESLLEQVDTLGLKVEGDASLWASGELALAEPDPSNVVALLEYDHTAPRDMDLIQLLEAQSHMPAEERDLIVNLWFPSEPGSEERFDSEQTLRAIRNYITDHGRVGCPILGKESA